MAENKQKTVQKQVESLKTKMKRTRSRLSNDPLGREEVEILLSKVADLQDYTMLLFGFYSGVRVGELKFGYDAIQFQEGYVHVWDEKKNRYRNIYVPEPVLMSLKRYWNAKIDKKSPLLFDLSSKTIERKIKRYTQEVLGKAKTWHCVRHTYITQSVEQGLPISIVISNTGDRPSTILAYYVKLSTTFIKEQINTKALFKVNG